MYTFLKKLLTSIIPLKYVFRYEELIRYPFALLYSGKSHQCNICSHQLKKFVANGLCPYCGSLPRHRRLYDLLAEGHHLQGKVLHFSPPRNLYRRLKKKNGISYYSTDFENEFISDYHYDITNISTENDFFDLIICYHVLEHIENDQKAISELYRVLKPNGIAFIQTPFKDGDIYENEHIKDPKDRLQHFGQEDHVRIYSVKGLVKRLESNQHNSVDILKFESTNRKSNLLGLHSNETILKLRK